MSASVKLDVLRERGDVLLGTEHIVLLDDVGNGLGAQPVNRLAIVVHLLVGTTAAADAAAVRETGCSRRCGGWLRLGRRLASAVEIPLP